MPRSSDGTGAIAAGTDATATRPERATASEARWLLLLTYGLAIGCGRDRAADHAGDGDQRQDVRQRLEEHGVRAARRSTSASRCASALEKPNRSAAAKAPNGRQLPKMSAASAMKPRPAVMFSLNECTKPIER